MRKLDRLYPLTEADKAVLEFAFTRTVDIAEGEDIVRQGDRPADCNLLLQGMVCRYKILDDGKRQIFAFHVPGDLYDAQSFLLNVLDHSISTITPCKVALIPHATMAHLTEAYPRIARAIWKDTLVDAAIFREWMASIGRRSAYQRIAHLICELYVRLDAVGLADGDWIAWPITQSELADALGLSNVHVNRSMMALRGDGLFQLKGNRLEISDWDGLKSAGQFDPGYLHLAEAAPKSEDGAERMVG